MTLSTWHQMQSRYRKIQHQKSNILKTNVEIEKGYQKLHTRDKNTQTRKCIWGLPKISFTLANVITKIDTNKSAIANEARNKFPIRRRLRSVAIAKQTRMFPVAARNINVAKNVAENDTKFIVDQKSLILFFIIFNFNESFAGRTNEWINEWCSQKMELFFCGNLQWLASIYVLLAHSAHK